MTDLYVKVIIGDADSMNRREFKTQVRLILSLLALLVCKYKY